MKYNFKNRPVKSTPQEYERWIKGFEKKVKNFDAQKWFDENVYEDWTWEGMLQKFIEKEILG
ncbi:unnamed protein product, partial [marine sediment metagenome]